MLNITDKYSSHDKSMVIAIRLDICLIVRGSTVSTVFVLNEDKLEEKPAMLFCDFSNGSTVQEIFIMLFSYIFREGEYFCIQVHM